MRKLSRVKLKGKVEKGRESRILNSLSRFSDKITTLYRKKIVYRLFWGRSNLYRNVIHISILFGTSFLFLTGFSNRFFASTQIDSTIEAGLSTAGNIDLLEQGGNIKSIVLAQSTDAYQVFDYKVAEGDTYDSIASRYSIEAESIKLSNLDLIKYYDSDPPVGTILRIPEVNGVLVKVEDGETLDGLMGRITKGERSDIIEINDLKAPNYTLASNTLVLIPDGLINPPAKPAPQIIYTAPPPPAPIPSPGEAVFAGVQFISPLSHPACSGHGYSRGFTGAWAHNGVDLTKGGGCPVRAAAGGTVERAVYQSFGAGNHIVINHGNGVKTLYFHGSTLWVKAGDYVPIGADIMQMACTGNCSGTHLHFSMKYNGAWIDPSPYVPYWRPY